MYLQATVRNWESTFSERLLCARPSLLVHSLRVRATLRVFFRFSKASAVPEDVPTLGLSRNHRRALGVGQEGQEPWLNPRLPPDAAAPLHHQGCTRASLRAFLAPLTGAPSHPRLLSEGPGFQGTKDKRTGSCLEEQEVLREGQGGPRRSLFFPPVGVDREGGPRGESWGPRPLCRPGDAGVLLCAGPQQGRVVAGDSKGGPCPPLRGLLPGLVDKFQAKPQSLGSGAAGVQGRIQP